MGLWKLRWMATISLGCVIVGLVGLMMEGVLPGPQSAWAATKSIYWRSCSILSELETNRRFGQAPIIRFAWVSIEGSVKNKFGVDQPSQALVLLQPVPSQTYSQAFQVGIQPENFPVVWLGVYECDAIGTYGQCGMNPFFDGDHKKTEDLRHGNLKWLSVNPPILWVQGADQADGSANMYSQYDYLVSFENSQPTILFQEDICLHSRLGGGGHWFGERVIKFRELQHEIDVIDSTDTVGLDAGPNTPLYHRKTGEFMERGMETNENEFCGEVHEERTRSFRLVNGKLERKSTMLKYEAQPEDRWSDIAEYYFKNPALDEYLKSHQPIIQTTSEPVAGQWIVIPL